MCLPYSYNFRAFILHTALMTPLLSLCPYVIIISRLSSTLLIFIVGYIRGVRSSSTISGVAFLCHLLHRLFLAFFSTIRWPAVPPAPRTSLSLLRPIGRVSHSCVITVLQAVLHFPYTFSPSCLPSPRSPGAHRSSPFVESWFSAHHSVSRFKTPHARRSTDARFGLLATHCALCSVAPQVVLWPLAATFPAPNCFPAVHFSLFLLVRPLPRLLALLWVLLVCCGIAPRFSPDRRTLRCRTGSSISPPLLLIWPNAAHDA